MKTTPSTESPAARLAHELTQAVSGEQIACVLRQTLSADTVARDGSRQPDHRARLDATKLLLSYTVGLPVQRTEAINVNLDAEASAGLHERLAKSPALREAIRKMLDAAEGKAPAVDV